VHVVTVNDYLARRDAESMGPVYRTMGLTVGAIVAGMQPADKREVYARDIVYCTNKELALRLSQGQNRALGPGPAPSGFNWSVSTGELQDPPASHEGASFCHRGRSGQRARR